MNSTTIVILSAILFGFLYFASDIVLKKTIFESDEEEREDEKRRLCMK